MDVERQPALNIQECKCMSLCKSSEERAKPTRLDTKKKISRSRFASSRSHFSFLSAISNFSFLPRLLSSSSLISREIYALLVLRSGRKRWQPEFTIKSPRVCCRCFSLDRNRAFKLISSERWLKWQTEKLLNCPRLLVLAFIESNLVDQSWKRSSLIAQWLKTNRRFVNLSSASCSLKNLTLLMNRLPTPIAHSEDSLKHQHQIQIARLRTCAEYFPFFSQNDVSCISGTQKTSRIDQKKRKITRCVTQTAARYASLPSGFLFPFFSGILARNSRASAKDCKWLLISRSLARG